MNSISRLIQHGTKFGIFQKKLSIASDHSNVLKNLCNSKNMIRSFSSKDSKSPPTSTKTATSPKNSSKGFVPEAAIVEQTPPPLTGPAKLEATKKEIIKLADGEIKKIKEIQEHAFSNVPQEAQNWLTKSAFVLGEGEDAGSATLTRETDKYWVRTSFSILNPEEMLDDDPESLQDLQQQKSLEGDDSEVGSDNEGKEPGEDADKVKSEEKPKSIIYRTELKFKNKEGEIKGAIMFTGEVGIDCRIYITDISAYEGTAPKNEGGLALFDRLGQDAQDKLYDLLDEVGVDDRMGSYMRFHVDSFEDRSTIEVMQLVQKILKD